MSKLQQALQAFNNPASFSRSQPGSTKHSSHPSFLQYPLTNEQLAVLKDGSSSISVQAFAGTGKTTLLRALSHQASRAKGYYLCFNQSIALQARSLFPEHVECRTHNSLALKSLGSRSPGWRQPSPGKLDSLTLHHLSSISGSDQYHLPLILDTLNAFIYSEDDFLQLKHAAQSPSLFFLPPDFPLDSHVQWAQTVWHRMSDPYSSIPMPHDGYLKLWSLHPTPLPVDYIMIDEAQDSNLPFLKAIQSQHCRLYFVGDEYQGIYRFRGAVNALQQLHSSQKFHLTQTHRFGSTISNLANALIHQTSSTQSLSSSPSAPHSTVVYGQAPLGSAPLYLARTNAGLFEQAFQLSQQGKYFALLGDAKFNFPDLSDLLALYHGHAQGQYVHFQSLDHLADKAQHEALNDLSLRIRLIQQYADDIPLMLQSINRFIQPLSPNLPQLSTVHQAKGLESSWVQLLPDFTFSPNDLTLSQELSLAQQDELHILYVALTRAQQGLALQSSHLQQWAQSLLSSCSFVEHNDVDLFS